MRVKCALHIHSDASYDGHLPLVEIAALYRRNGYQAVFTAEHSQSLDSETLCEIRREAASLSDNAFIIIPGIEYSCPNTLHIVGLGCELLLDASDPVQLAFAIRDADGLAVLAHPQRMGWRVSPQLVKSVNAVEVWNVRYDGKFLPMPEALEAFNRMRADNPSLLAVVGDDFHSLGGFYPLGVLLEVDSLSREAIMKELSAGRFRIKTDLFDAWPGHDFPTATIRRLRLFRTLLDIVKRIVKGTEK